MYFRENAQRSSILIGKIAIHKIRLLNTRNRSTPIRAKYVLRIVSPKIGGKTAK